MTCPNCNQPEDVCRCSPRRSFQTVEGCMWPHHVTQPICVYDRDSLEKYKSGEYKPPVRCICGAEITYDAPVCVCLVEHGQLNGEMLIEVEVPVPIILEIGEGVDPSTVKVEINPPPDLNRIIVKCKHTGQILTSYALPNGLIRWSCPCGFRYEKAVSELGMLPDEVMIDDHCPRRK